MKIKNILILGLIIGLGFSNPVFSYQHSERQIIKSLRKCTKRINKHPDKVSLYIKRGYLNFQMGNIQDAIKDYSSAEDLQPDNSDIYYSRGQLELKLKKYNLALDDFNKAMLYDLNYVRRDDTWSSTYANYWLVLKSNSSLTLNPPKLFGN